MTEKKQNRETTKLKEQAQSGKLFDDLVQKMAELRGENGCPWDKEQSHLSLKKYLIEEAYEACEAIEQGIPERIAEELGDVLLQVVFHAEVGRQAGTFSIGEVIEILINKLVERHPHVFGDDHLDTAEEVLKQWEQNKLRQSEDKTSILDGVPKGLPALLKAMRVQERVQRVGFDWERTEQVLEKVREEIGEFEQAIESNDRAKMQDELGDCFFALVNLARFVDLDPERALSGTVKKFCTRFRYIEKKIAEQGNSLEEVDLAEMDFHWEQAKSKT